MNKVLIIMEGGIVQHILSSSEDTEVLLIDRDTEGADPDEFLKSKEIENFIKGIEFKEPKLMSGVSDDTINIQ